MILIDLVGRLLKFLTPNFLSDIFHYLMLFFTFGDILPKYIYQKEKQIMKGKIVAISALLVISSSMLFSKTLATVNGHQITDSVVPSGFEKLDESKKKLLVNRLVQEEILFSHLLGSNTAKSANFSKIYEKQKSIAQSQYKKSTGKNLNDEQLRSVKGSVALALYQQELFKNAKATDAEMKSFYKQNASKMKHPDAVKVVAMTFKTKDEASKAINRLKSAKDVSKEFSAIAKESKQKGFIGWIGKGKVPASFFSQLYAMKQNSLTATPIKMDKGFVVALLLEKKPAGLMSFEQVKVDMENFVKQEKVKKTLQMKIQELSKSAKVTY